MENEFEVQQEAAQMHMGRRAFLAATMAVGSVFGAIGVLDAAPAEAAVPQATAGDCAPINFGTPSANSGDYESDAFLPKADSVNNGNKVRKYINELFSDGPLANKTDKASLSAIMSAVVEPANDGVATDPDYDYKTAFDAAWKSYNANPGGSKAAENDCKQSLNTLVQVASYDDKWEAKGATVTQFVAVPNKDNVKVDLVFRKVVTNKDLKGIKLSLPKTAKGLDGFTEVLISTNNGKWDGSIFIKGVTKGTNEGETTKGTKNKDKNPDSSSQSPNQNQNQTAAVGGATGNTVSNAGGGGTFGASNGNGESNKAGNVAESGGNSGARPGEAPSFGNGGGNNGGGSTPETPSKPTPTVVVIPAPPVTTQAPPPPTTTTSPPPTTTTLPPKVDKPLPPPPSGY